MVHSPVRNGAGARPLRRRILATVLGWTVCGLGVAGSGCAETVLERSFDPTASEPERLPPLRVVDGVRMWVVEMRYGQTWVEVLLRVENNSARRVRIAREGLLMAMGELEYPVDVDTPHAVLPVTSIEAGQNAELRLSYPLTRPMAESGTLRIRTLEIAGGATAPVELPLPPHPTAQDAG